jgi:outer membrane lipoprotein SlyB
MYVPLLARLSHPHQGDDVEYEVVYDAAIHGGLNGRAIANAVDKKGNLLVVVRTDKGFVVVVVVERGA